MRYAIELHPIAEKELAESYQWYEERLYGLGKRFVEAVEKKITLISDTPEVYSKKKGSYRETFVDDFPFTIVYEIIDKQKTIFISAVFHTRRNPKLKYKRR